MLLCPQRAFGNPRLEDRIGKVKLGHEAGLRRRAGADGSRTETCLERGAAYLQNRSARILQRAFMMIPANAALDCGQPHGVSCLYSRISLVDSGTSEADLRIFSSHESQRGRHVERVFGGNRRWRSCWTQL